MTIDACFGLGKESEGALAWQGRWLLEEDEIPVVAVKR